MTELKPKFLRLSKLALIEFSLNHPGCKVVAKLMEAMEDISEESIVAAYEQYGNLYAPIDEYICYKFTNGRNDFKKPKWLIE